MKIDDVILELRKNPNKKFGRMERDGVISVDGATQEIMLENGDVNFMFDGDWVEMKKLATWQQAIQALMEGKIIECDLNGDCITYDCSKGCNDFATTLVRLEAGKWYIWC